MEGGSQADSCSPGGGRAQSPAVLGSLWGAAPKRAQPLVWGQVGMWSQASHRSPCVRRHGPSVLGKQQKGHWWQHWTLRFALERLGPRRVQEDSAHRVPVLPWGARSVQATLILTQPSVNSPSILPWRC